VCAEAMFWKMSCYENVKVHYFNFRLFIVFAKKKKTVEMFLSGSSFVCLLAYSNSANRRNLILSIFTKICRYILVFIKIGHFYVNWCAFQGASWAWLAKYLSKLNSFGTEVAQNSVTRLLCPLPLLHTSYGKIKLSLCLINWTPHMKTYGEAEV
jgi:hypothetical protein